MKVQNQVITDQYAIYQGDSCELIKAIPDNSIGLSVYSPPFAELFAYSDSERDLGNSKSYDEFFEHFAFLIQEMHRITKPGRIVAFHCIDIPAMKERDGYIGLKDFPGDLLRAFQKAGFIYHSKHTIWKDPLIEATRTKAIGLMHKQLCKDSSRCRAGLPDYLIAVRKDGENTDPIPHENGLTEFYGESQSINSGVKFSHDTWRKYASPVWMDIRQSYTLNKNPARDDKDVKHICLATGTLILTDKGYVPIESVNVGDMALTHEGRWKPVIAKKCTGVRPVIQNHAMGVPHLVMTPDHKMWTRQSKTKHEKTYAQKQSPEWVESGKTLSSYVNQKLPPIKSSNLTNSEWWLVGRYLADGHVGVRGDFHISVGNHKVDEFLSKAADYIGFSVELGSTTQFRIKNASEQLKEMLRKCGKGAHNKQVPIDGICLNAELAESLLSGYLSGDGHIDALGRWHITSISRSLLLGMAMVAQRARNAVSSVYAGKKPGKHVIEGRIVNAKQCWVMLLSPRNQSAFIADDGAWKKVRKLEDKGESEVWSLRVADDASYTAEGCIVKNCPLQLDVIERAIELWSNKNDTVYSPFLGIGSEGYVAVKRGRKFIGSELKESYFKVAAQNLELAAKEASALTLFDMVEPEIEPESELSTEME